MTENTNQNPESKSSNRRRSRELALSTLYAWEVSSGEPWTSIFERITQNHEYAHEVQKYASNLIRKTIEYLESIDETIVAHTSNWDLKRMAAIDRNVLRVAVTELLYFEEVPYRVVIDEAIELAKAYGTDDSGKFVNGIIDSIRKKRLGNKPQK